MRKLLVLVLAIITIKTHACTVNVEGKLNEISYFSIKNGNFVDSHAKICVNFAEYQDDSEVYIARLDYLPYYALSASNDNPLKFKNGSYRTIISVTKLSDPLVSNKKEHNYNFCLQIREGMKVFLPGQDLPFLIYRYLYQEYLIILIILLMASFLAQRIIFRKSIQFQPQQIHKKQ